jgi:hypothetical protein
MHFEPTSDSDGHPRIQLRMATALMSACLFLVPAPHLHSRSAPAVEWTRTFAGWGGARGSSVQQTSDGGYVAVGYTSSRDSTPERAALLVKLDASGDSQWAKTFKAAGGMKGSSVVQTSDGGYVVAGSATGHPCLFKTDASGNELWRSCLKKSWANAYSVVRLGDTGYTVVVGTGLGDSAVILWRTDNMGNTRWLRAYNIHYDYDANMDLALSRTSDGGYIVGTKALLKVDSLGAQQSVKTFTGMSKASSVIQTSDGGYAATGTTSDHHSIYLLKTNTHRGSAWMRTYMPSDWSRGHSVEQTTDGGYIIAGTSRDSCLDDKVTLVRTRPDGVPGWTDTLFSGEGASVRQTLDGGYIVCGTTRTGPTLFVAKLAPDRAR